MAARAQELRRSGRAAAESSLERLALQPARARAPGWQALAREAQRRAASQVRRAPGPAPVATGALGGRAALGRWEYPSIAS